jgi:hypothetical protein
MSQRKRSRRIASDESEEESQETPRTQKRRRVSDSDDDGETQGTQGAQKKQITHQEKQKLIGEMMRFMLFSESHKKPLRKDEVNKNVMKNYKNRKLYDEIFAEAKHQLLNTFGYEVVELIPEGKKASNAQYAMINKLSGNPLLLEYVEMPDARELTLLTTILDMIYINDELLDQDVLYEQLRILGLTKGEQHPVFGDWDKMITNWIRQGYITKKRNDTGREGQVTYDLSLGPRALHVVTRKNLLKHVAAVLNEDVDPIRAKELEDKESENQKNSNNNAAENGAPEQDDIEDQPSQPIQRSNNNNNTFRPMVGALPSGSNSGRSSTTTYSKKGRAAQRPRNSTVGSDDDD